MRNLKKYLIRLFILVTFAMAVLNSVIQSVFETKAENITNKSIMVQALFFYLAASLLILVLGAVIFTRMVSRKIEEENIRNNNERNMLFANISHDLKTPITTIMGFSKALYDGMVNEAEKKELLNSIYEKSQRVNELLDLMFQYTKLNGLDFKLKMDVTDIGRIIKETTALYYNEFEKRNMEINIKIPERPIKRNLDRVEFSRAISNLIINAYQHNKSGNKVSIMLEENACIRIMVADDGEEIKEDKKGDIFNPFVCGDESRNSKGGNGLGLAITKRIIEKHGGKIYINSDVDGYTKGFVIELK